MNKRERKEIEPLLERAKEIADELENMADLEREKIDNLPENLQGSERADRFDEVADALSEAADTMRDAVTTAEEAIA